MKSPYFCFSSNFCFLVFVVFVSGLIVPVLLLNLLISLPLLFMIESPSSPRHCIDASSQPSMQAIPLTLFLTYRPSMPSLVCKSFRQVISFLVLWYIYLSSFLVNLKNILDKGNYSDIHPFNEISAADFGFEKMFRSTEVLFTYSIFGWFDLVWFMAYCKLFNAKFCSCTYIKYIYDL